MGLCVNRIKGFNHDSGVIRQYNFVGRSWQQFR